MAGARGGALAAGGAGGREERLARGVGRGGLEDVGPARGGGLRGGQGDDFDCGHFEKSWMEMIGCIDVDEGFWRGGKY